MQGSLGGFQRGLKFRGWRCTDLRRLNNRVPLEGFHRQRSDWLVFLDSLVLVASSLLAPGGFHIRQLIMRRRQSDYEALVAAA